MDIKKIINSYKGKRPTITVLGSHSALDVCMGAKKQGFRTLVIAEQGREKTYAQYYKKNGGIGCIDECIIVNDFKDLLTPALQKKLIQRHAIFIPHRSFEVYLNFAYDQIENEFRVPIFGNRYLLKIEERGTKPNQYDLLERAHIRYPKIFTDSVKIDRLCMVKVLEKARGFERAFFMVKNHQDYQRKVKNKLQNGAFTKEQLKKAVIEEFISGVQVNFNFFYSPVNQRLELLGTDTRRQTNIEGLLKIPGEYQHEAMKHITPQYEEAGHIAVTILESMLEKVYELGERFIKACNYFSPPGVIGPFALQSFITPGPPAKDIVVVDVSPRMPGSPGLSATPYSSYLFGYPLSMGERIGIEIKNALHKNKIDSIIT